LLDPSVIKTLFSFVMDPNLSIKTLFGYRSLVVICMPYVSDMSTSTWVS